MAEERVQRRLAAILAADVVGYSRLMEQDEAGTLATLKARREEVLKPLVARHQGRVFKVAGDGALVEFSSAVSAVQRATDLQNGMAQANVGVTEDRRVTLRIGVNLGDVIIEGADLYGDGVNIAARLETLAEPGGILVSHTVVSQVRGKVQFSFEDLGEQSLKNLTEPVRVYRVSAATATVGNMPSKAGHSTRPSIAVLPFTNMSGDPEQQYFSDGITEDIITELARDRSLLVIARNSSFNFRGPSVDMGAVRRALGVRYIVEGSVRKAGARLRITAQLIDAVTQSHLWAERYDRDIEQIFAVQDEVTRAIVATLEGRIAATGAEQARRKPTTDWVAYNYFLQGRDYDYRYEINQAISFFTRAAELDPDYVQAHACLAAQLCFRYLLDERSETLDQAATHAQRAVTLDANDAYAHNSMGWVALRRRHFDLAGYHFDRSVNLNPHEVGFSVDWANWLMYVNRLDEALRSLDMALQRDPYPPTYIWEVRGQILYFLKRYDEAIAAFLKMRGAEHFWMPMFLAAAFAQSGKSEDACRELARFLEVKAKTFPGCASQSPVSTASIPKAWSTRTRAYAIVCWRDCARPGCRSNGAWILERTHFRLGHIASFRCTAPVRQQLGVKRTPHGHGWIDASDPMQTYEGSPRHPPGKCANRSTRIGYQTSATGKPRQT
jgi:TolB-like protein/class 3 adenylate cyclase